MQNPGANGAPDARRHVLFFEMAPPPPWLAFWQVDQDQRPDRRSGANGSHLRM